VMGREIDSFFDCFSGTGVVAQAFRKHAKRVIANDILYSNHVIHRAFISSTRKTVSVRRLDSLCEHLNSLKPVKGYAYENFADTYFTAENTAIIDSIREEIERLYTEKECTEAEKMCMLASLMYAMDKTANTVGQYDAFLKHIFATQIAGGKHRIDVNVRKPLTLKRPLIFFDGVNQAYREDAGVLASKIKADVAYVDPPYNSRQYVDCYHVLENVARWEKPKTFGKTKKFPRQGERSLFSQKRMAHLAISSLVEVLQCEHIFMSYNSEGILNTEEILDVLGKKGKVTLFEKEYPVFGNGAGVSVNRKVTERLYYCKVTQCAAKN
jgi:adenine-specific DNA-methyltransferase